MVVMAVVGGVNDSGSWYLFSSGGGQCLRIIVVIDGE